MSFHFSRRKRASTRHCIIEAFISLWHEKLFSLLFFVLQYQVSSIKYPTTTHTLSIWEIHSKLHCSCKLLLAFSVFVRRVLWCSSESEWCIRSTSKGKFMNNCFGLFRRLFYIVFFCKKNHHHHFNWNGEDDEMTTDESSSRQKNSKKILNIKNKFK